MGKSLQYYLTTGLPAPRLYLAERPSGRAIGHGGPTGLIAGHIGLLYDRAFLVVGWVQAQLFQVTDGPAHRQR